MTNDHSAVIVMFCHSVMVVMGIRVRTIKIDIVCVRILKREDKGHDIPCTLHMYCSTLYITNNDWLYTFMYVIFTMSVCP